MSSLVTAAKGWYPAGTHFSLYTTPGTWKNTFTAIFLILGFAISTFGSYFLRRRNMHQLVSKRDAKLPVTHMSSWLPLQSIVFYIWNTKYKLPGGLQAITMILAGALSLGHGFFVNNFVESSWISVHDGCQFGTGVVTTIMSGRRYVGKVSFDATAIIQNAQNAAATNYNIGANARSTPAPVYGIYNAIDKNNVGVFNPSESDVLGRWNCGLYLPQPSFQFVPRPSSKNVVAETNDLFRKQTPNFLFHDPSLYSDVGDGDFYGKMINWLYWSANETNTSNDVWSLRASVFNALSIKDDVATVRNIECNLTKYNSTWVPPIMAAHDTLKAWLGAAQGYLQSASPDEFPLALGLMLDTITMSSGGNSDGSALPPKDSKILFRPTYGCLKPGTAIWSVIWVPIGLSLLILIPMIVYDLFLVVYDFTKHGKDGMTSQAEFVKDAPHDVQTWQLALLRQTLHNHSIELKDLKNYSYGWNPDKAGNFEFMKYDANASKISAGSSLIQSPDPSTDMPTSPTLEKSTTNDGYSSIPHEAQTADFV